MGVGAVNFHAILRDGISQKKRVVGLTKGIHHFLQQETEWDLELVDREHC